MQQVLQELAVTRFLPHGALFGQLGHADSACTNLLIVPWRRMSLLFLWDRREAVIPLCEFRIPRQLRPPVRLNKKRSCQILRTCKSRA